MLLVLYEFRKVKIRFVVNRICWWRNLRNSVGNTVLPWNGFMFLPWQFRRLDTPSQYRALERLWWVAIFGIFQQYCTCPGLSTALCALLTGWVGLSCLGCDWCTFVVLYQIALVPACRAPRSRTPLLAETMDNLGVCVWRFKSFFIVFFSRGVVTSWALLGSISFRFFYNILFCYILHFF